MDDIKESLGENFVPEPIIALGRMLHDHVRLEEDHIFPRIERALSEIELNSVGSRLTRLHGER
jgi:hemerythrin-like domain-containing protein